MAVIMNTSFNLRGEPIVCTPKDAIRTFYSSGLDFLVMGDFVRAKDPAWKPQGVAERFTVIALRASEVGSSSTISTCEYRSLPFAG